MNTQNCPSTVTSLRSRLKFVTVNGIDESTSLELLNAQSIRFPLAEYGVLYNQSLQGNGRFPRMKWISSLPDMRQGMSALKLSLHVCGSDVYQLLHNEGHVSEIAHDFPRIRLNLHTSTYPVGLVMDLLDRFPEKMIITTRNSSNRGMWKLLAEKPNHALLLNATGNAGVIKHGWAPPLFDSDKEAPVGPLLGLAGGLGSDNFVIGLGHVPGFAYYNDFWVDIGRRLSSSADHFDVQRTEQFLNAVEASLDKRNSFSELSSFKGRNPALNVFNKTAAIARSDQSVFHAM